MNYWQDSFGFIAVVGACVVYILGLFIVIILDIGPQRKVKHKLMMDFRNIDRFGLRDDNDEHKDEISLKSNKTVSHQTD